MSLSWGLKIALAIIVFVLLWMALAPQAKALPQCSAANRGTIIVGYHYYDICTGPPVEGTQFHWHRYVF